MTDYTEIAQRLASVPVFSCLKKRQLEKLARTFSERTCVPGEVIVPQGRGGYGFFILVEGKAKAVRKLENGEEVVVNIFGPGDFFGEMALLDGGPRTASVIAEEPTRCLIMPRENFLGVLREDGEIAVAILEEVARRFRAALEASL